MYFFVVWHRSLAEEKLNLFELAFTTMAHARAQVRRRSLVPDCPADFSKRAFEEGPTIFPIFRLQETC
jgi:hypothetical protein